jgi:hypothetical protein
MKTSADVVAAIQSIPLEMERLRSGFESSLQQFHNGVRLDAARVVSLGSRRLLWAGSCRLVGWSIAIDGGPGGDVILRDGRDGNGDVVAVLDDSTPSTQWMGPGGLSITEALSIEFPEGAQLVGAVWLGAVD